MTYLGDPFMKYGLNNLWSTPVRLGNLLEEGAVGEKLHSWLEKYADDPRLVSGPISDIDNKEKHFTRYDVRVFTSPAHRQLRRIKELLIERADEYATDAMVNPLPEHEKHAVFWFVIQHPNNLNEPLLPHYHEGSDVGLVYYLSTPSNGSGGIMMIDPRGLIARGGHAFPKQKPGFQYSPRRGDLLILPRYVLHYTSVNTDTCDRKIIAGVVRYDLPYQKSSEHLIQPRKYRSRKAAASKSKT